MAATSLRRVTSASRPTAVPPARSTSAATVDAASPLMSASTTRPPSAAQSRAVPAPNPEPAPVTTTVFPSRRLTISLDRKRAGAGRSVQVLVELGGGRPLKQKSKLMVDVILIIITKNNIR